MSAASSLALDHFGCLPGTDVDGVLDLTVTLTIAADQCLQMGQFGDGVKRNVEGVVFQCFLLFTSLFLETLSCLVDFIIAAFPSFPGLPLNLPLTSFGKDLSVSASFLPPWFYPSLTCTQHSNPFL